MSMLPIFFAQDKGLFREEGLDPQLVFVGGRLQVPALAAGEVDFSASAETVLRAAVQGLPLKVVVYMNSRMAVSLIAAPDIKTIAGLKGRSIAVTSIGGSLDYAAREILAKNGLNPERDARFVGIAQSEQMLALSAGSIQAAMLTPPYDSMMEKKGFRRLVFVGDVLDYPQGGLATTDKKLQENAAQVKRVVRTMVRSLIRIRQNREELVPYIANRWKMDTRICRIELRHDAQSLQPERLYEHSINPKRHRLDQRAKSRHRIFSRRKFRSARRGAAGDED